MFLLTKEARLGKRWLPRAQPTKLIWKSSKRSSPSVFLPLDSPERHLVQSMSSLPFPAPAVTRVLRERLFLWCSSEPQALCRTGRGCAKPVVRLHYLCSCTSGTKEREAKPWPPQMLHPTSPPPPSSAAATYALSHSLWSRTVPCTQWDSNTEQPSFTEVSRTVPTAMVPN